MVFYPQIIKDCGPIPNDVIIPEWIFAARRQDGAKVAFIDSVTDEHRTWVDVQKRCRLLARGLAKQFNIDVTSSEATIFGIITPNNIEVPIAVWGAQLAGGTVTGMNPAYTPSEIKYQSEVTQLTACYTCKDMLDVVKAGCPKNVKIILLDGVAEGCLNINQLIKLGESSPEIPRIVLKPGENRKRLAFLSFSSGTTGKPKGVKISHYNVIANSIQNREFYFQGKPKQELATSLALIPLFHIYGLVVIMHTEILVGNTVCMVPKFDLNNFLDCTEKYKISIMFLVPPLVVRLTKDPEVAKRGKPLKDVKMIFCGAAPLSAQLQGELRKAVHPDAIVRQGYGMTETCTTATIVHDSDQWDGSVGVAIPNVSLKLVDQEGKEVTEYDKPGELWVRGPSVTSGYYKNQKATDECYLPIENAEERFGDIWLRTGDEAVVRVSPKGFEHFFIVDRLKELIKVKGLQVAPAELEAALLDHPDIADAAVIGIPDDYSGELPKGFVVLHAGVERNDATIKSICKHIEDTKARFKWIKPANIEFLDVVPKSASGKILRKDLRLLGKKPEAKL
ncbi:phenylacetyl-CoA ligase [Protomyces lactucae-debilis]|uniref:Phenylacetyl-CoA ligase n=1 Tax=Protomyces lactucae-debilis TaxID=2754530 RepID=A0A1Y2FDT3_PROLT|nr:phenylacetyl-CoA ligase [Protomyces lactucae-debilis]ORY82081.1 phenylacetyl-CoA ligase [Protomyces lactucae-debilis]